MLKYHWRAEYNYMVTQAKTFISASKVTPPLASSFEQKQQLRESVVFRILHRQPYIDLNLITSGILFSAAILQCILKLSERPVAGLDLRVCLMNT